MPERFSFDCCTRPGAATFFLRRLADASDPTIGDGVDSVKLNAGQQHLPNLRLVTTNWPPETCYSSGFAIARHFLLLRGTCWKAFCAPVHCCMPMLGGIACVPAFEFCYMQFDSLSNFAFLFFSITYIAMLPKVQPVLCKSTYSLYIPLQHLAPAIL